MTHPKLSIVIPIHDEADSIETLYRELDAALSSVEGGIEMLLVDDGSRDGSLQAMRDLALKDQRVRVLSLDGQYGQSAAFDAGFRAMRGEIAVTMDGDLQNDPADIPKLLAELEHADVVNGVRADRHDSWLRKLSSRIGNGFRNWLTQESVTDVGCSLRVMRAEYVRRIKLVRGMHRFLPTLLRMEGARLTEVPVSHRSRRYGESKYGIRNRLFVGLVDTIAVRWMQRRSTPYKVTEYGRD